MWTSFSTSPSRSLSTGIPVHVVLVGLLLDHRLCHLGGLAALGQLGLEGGQLPVADLGDALQVAMTLGTVSLHLQLVDASRDLLHAVEDVLLARPARGELVAARLGLGELALDRLAHLGRLLRHRGELDLELRHAPLRLVELDGRRVDLHPQPRGRLVDEVDRLVGEEAVGDVAVGEHRGRDERRIADAHAVVRLVALLQAPEDADRVGDRRLADEHRLEAALEGGILLDVGAVLVERGRADRTQLAPGEHRLEEVARRDGALGRPRPDDRVQLVDEEDDLALGRGDLLQDGLEPLLELSPVLRAGHERTDVERPHALSLQSLRHIAGDDALRETLRDRRLAHAGLADQDGVVLRAPGEHLDRAADLLVAADHGVELPVLCEGRQVAAVLLERLVAALRILRGHPLATAHLLERPQQRLARHHVEPQQQVLDRDELVAELRRFLERPVEHAAEARPRLGHRAPGDRRLLAQPRLRLGAERVRLAARALDERPGELLVEQRDREVIGGHLGVPETARELLSSRDRLAALHCQLVEVHGSPRAVGQCRPTMWCLCGREAGARGTA
jgi:hypothetical protein